MRSRKLVQATAKIDYDSLKFPLKSEDVVVCHYLYDKMIEEGLIEEVKGLRQKFPENSPGFQALGYKECLEFLKGDISLEKMIECVRQILAI